MNDLNIRNLIKHVSTEPYSLYPLRNHNLNSEDIIELFKNTYGLSDYLYSSGNRDVLLLLLSIAPVCSPEVLLSLFGFPEGSYHRMNRELRGLSGRGCYVNHARFKNHFSRTLMVYCLSQLGDDSVRSKSIYRPEVGGLHTSESYVPVIKSGRKALSEKDEANLIHELCLGYTLLSFLFSPLAPFYVEGREIKVTPSRMNLQRKNSLRIDAILRAGMKKNGSGWKYKIFVEQDMGTEYLAQLQDKFDRYYYNSDRLGEIENSFILFSSCQNLLGADCDKSIFSKNAVGEVTDLLAYLSEHHVGKDFDETVSDLLDYGRYASGEQDNVIMSNVQSSVEKNISKFIMERKGGFGTHSAGRLKGKPREPEEVIKGKAVTAMRLLEELKMESPSALKNLEALCSYNNALSNLCLPEYIRCVEKSNYSWFSKKANSLIDAYLSMAKAHVDGVTNFISEKSILLFMEGFRCMMTPTMLTGNVLPFLFPRECLYDMILTCLDEDKYLPGIAADSADCFSIPMENLGEACRTGGLTMRNSFSSNNGELRVFVEDLANDLSAWVRSYKFIHGVSLSSPYTLVMMVRDYKDAVKAASKLDMRGDVTPYLNLGWREAVFIRMEDLANGTKDSLFRVSETGSIIRIVEEF